MKVALIINKVSSDIDANLSLILSMINDASDQNADLVMLPEAALTGLLITDEPTVDLPLGQDIPGKYTNALSEIAVKKKLWIATGLLERDDTELYDSAILISPDGEIELKYRRISTRWHAFNIDNSVYREGSEIPIIETPLGYICFLICGDLFDDGLVEHVKYLNPNYLLVPFARCFDDGSANQVRWDNDEMPVYAEQAKMSGCTTLMTNYLAGDNLDDGGTFGGAMIFSPNGETLAQYPLGKKGILYFNFQHS